MDTFSIVHNRQHTRSMKWDMLDTVFNTEDVLPMWVADMDFKAPNAVRDALMNCIDHGIFGYTVIDNNVKDAIINWNLKRNDWEVSPESLSFTPGVVTSLHFLIQLFTEENDKILIQTPVYTPFHKMIKQHNRKMVKNPLQYMNNQYVINFDDFEEKIKQGVKAFILCSPHNPVGRVWTRNELTKMAEICLKHNVLIFSDEIHSDLILEENSHIPIASLSEEVADVTITCMSPTKTFNLAGLHVSYMITKNPEKQAQIKDFIEKQGLDKLNTMGVVALEAAYKYGEPWLKDLLDVINNNKKYVINQFKTCNKELKVIDSEATYLLWVDCSSLGFDAKELNDFMIKKAKVGLNTGISYGEEGKQFMRINIACPRKTLEKGVAQIIEAVNQL